MLAPLYAVIVLEYTAYNATGVVPTAGAYVVISLAPAVVSSLHPANPVQPFVVIFVATALKLCLSDVVGNVNVDTVPFDV